MAAPTPTEAHASPAIALWRWALFDFANSPFATLVVTFLYPVVFARIVVGDELLGTTLWSRAVGFSGLLAALLAPAVGAWIDRGGLARPILRGLVGVLAAGCILLAGAGPDDVTLAMGSFVLANLAFELGMVAYNALLIRVAQPARRGFASGLAWGIGYLGGLAALGIALVGFVLPERPWFGLDHAEGEAVRAVPLLVAMWLLLFALPLLTALEPAPRRRTLLPLARDAFAELRRALAYAWRRPTVLRFLLARLCYNDGLVTIFAFGGLYAAGVFGFDNREILLFGILLNVAAGLGALTTAWFEDRVGSARVVWWSTLALGLASALAVAAPSRGWLWVAGSLIGWWAGPNQSASRAYFSHLVPPQEAHTLYGLYAFSGKATAFVGPFLVGVVTAATDSQRTGVAVVLLFFAAGAILLWPIRGDRGGLGLPTPAQRTNP